MTELIEILKSNQRDKSQPPHLSASSLTTHMRCPRQWQQSYIFGEKGGKSDALVIGSGVHLCLSRRFMGLPEGDWWTEACEGYTPEDSRSQGVAEAMVYHYWEYIGKFITPVATEREILVNVPGVELPILGYIDLETADRNIDYKTTRYFSRKGVRPNKEWRLAQGIYQLDTPKPSEIHVLTRAKNDPVVIPDSTSHPLHIGLVNAGQVVRTVQYEWQRIKDNWENYGYDSWPGNSMHEWAHKYCSLKDCCSL
jgi:hypothetical protein